jgi:SAM-dependent methyltransferase
MLGALEARVGSRFRFLDLGTGTGSLSERICRQFPNSRGVAIDFDPVLLKLARTGLGDERGRLRWVETDLRSRSSTRSLPPGQFDAVVSSTALHWLAGRELKDLYRQIAGRIRKGGLFLNADELAYPRSSTAFREAARFTRKAAAVAAGETWDDWWSAIERDRRFSAEVALRRERYPHSHMGTPTPDLDGHVRRLRSAGFREVEVIWSRWQNRVLAAIR